MSRIQSTSSVHSHRNSIPSHLLFLPILRYVSQGLNDPSVHPTSVATAAMNIDTAASWEAGAVEQAAVNAASEHELLSAPSSQLLSAPSSQPIILSQDTRVIIVGNHKTEKDMYIGMQGVVTRAQPLSFRRDYGYQVLLDEVRSGITLLVAYKRNRPIRN